MSYLIKPKLDMCDLGWQEDTLTEYVKSQQKVVFFKILIVWLC